MSRSRDRAIDVREPARGFLVPCPDLGRRVGGLLGHRADSRRGRFCSCQPPRGGHVDVRRGGSAGTALSGAGTGINVYGVPSYGAVTTDILLSLWPKRKGISTALL